MAPHRTRVGVLAAFAIRVRLVEVQVALFPRTIRKAKAAVSFKKNTNIEIDSSSNCRVLAVVSFV